MSEHNDRILERIRGITPNKDDWRDKFNPQNPNVPNANDNEILLKSAQDALARQRARHDEDTEKWARNLANDLAQFRD